MPYELVPQSDGTFKVCKRDNHNKCFSKKGMTKKKAEKQMKAIIISENLKGAGFNQKMYDELQASIPSKEKWEASQKRSKRVSNQTYEEWRKMVEDINKKRAYIDDEANARVSAMIEQAKRNNEEYARKVAENPDLENVWCNYNENGEAKKTMTTKGQCRINNEKHFQEWEKKNHPANYYFFRPAVDTIAKATSFLADVVPMPKIVKDIGKSVAQAGLEANSYTPTEKVGRAKPKDAKLYKKIKDEVYKKNPKHSLYRSALIQKIYQSEGGKYIDDKMPKMNIKKWFKQDWISLNDYLRGENVACGNSDTKKKYNEYPLCKMRSVAEKLSKGDIKKLIEEKNKLKEKPLRTEKVLDRKDVNIKSTITGLGKDKFSKQLHKLNITKEEYLNNAKKVAKLRGYNPDLLKLADDDKHKLEYNGVKFGAVGYNDFLLYLHQANEGLIPFEYAIEKMANYRARSEVTMKKTNNKFSPASLSYYILW